MKSKHLTYEARVTGHTTPGTLEPVYAISYPKNVNPILGGTSDDLA